MTEAIPRRRWLRAAFSLGGLFLSGLLLAAGSSAQARAPSIKAGPGGDVAPRLLGSRSHVLASGPTAALTIVLSGTDRAGTVTSADRQINCASACSGTYPSGTTVTLTAAPVPGSRFLGWTGGGCSGTGSCVVVMTADTTVTAQFQTPPPATKLTGLTVTPQRRLISFRFMATGATSRFLCGLARAGKRAHLVECGSPWTYDKIDPGVYVFIVQAVGPGGADPGPATDTVTAPIEFSNCWGAASRDPQHRCGNPALRNVVVPTPDNALLIPLGFCGGEEKIGPVSMCSFGVDPSKARKTIALIGDSHAGALLPAMSYVAHTESWQGLAYIHNGCLFSDARLNAKASYADGCTAWRQKVTAWLFHQPEISSLVITGSDERSFLGNAEAGFQNAWKALPPTIHRIYIIRDVPRETLNEASCVANAQAHHRPAGVTCAQPRSTVLPRDAEAAAAANSPGPRVRLIDLTAILCDKSRCFPVIGGALTEKDVQHLTREFSLSLGPYVLRAIQQAR